MNINKIIVCLLLAAAFSLAGPVSYYGALTVDGNRIKDKNKSNVVQLKGPSYFWSDGSGLGFYNWNTVDWFVDTMDVSVIRYAMAVRYMNSSGNAQDEGAGDGYLISESNKISQKDRIDAMVQAAIRNDIYIIIDWHSHRAHNEQAAAVEFFREMANKYKSTPNVIFEIYNEPVASWGSISAYMRAVIEAIRNAGSDNLILVGSPSWSSNPNEAAASNFHKNYKNIAYTMHFYAGTHVMNSASCGPSQCSNSATAMGSQYNAAVFVSEWGTTSADGGGSPNSSSTKNWTNWMDANKVSSCNWSVSNFETSSIINQNASLSVNNLSASGKLFYSYMGGNGTATLGKTNPPANWPWARSRTLQLKEGETKNFTASELSLSTGAAFETSGHTATEGQISATASQLTFVMPQESRDPNIFINYYIAANGNRSKHRITVNIVRGPRASVSALDVSKTQPTVFTTTSVGKLGITHPDGRAMTFTAQNVSAGSIARSSDNKQLTYTPPANATEGQTATLTYTVADNVGNSIQKTVALTLKNVSPTAGSQTASTPNTTPYTFSLDFNSEPKVGDKLLPGSDGDGDPITIHSAEVEAGFPGTVAISGNKRSITYTPEAGKKSGAKPIVYYVLTDGQNFSAEGQGKLTFTITGTGSDIVQQVTPILGTKSTGAFGLRMLGKSLSVELAKSGFASLDLYSINGAKAANFMNSYQNAGNYEFSTGNLQKGVYIVRLKQGSEVKILRIAVGK